MAHPDQKIPFASTLVARTAATLPPGNLKNALEHTGSQEHALFHAIATMIELSQQKPGPQSEKAKAVEKLAEPAPTK